jgi:hypothetical protein
MCEIDWTAVAAWVQAIGSIAAIFFAVKVGRDSDTRARNLVKSERDRQSKIAANIFYMQFGRLSAEIGARLKEVAKLKAQPGEYPGPAIKYFALSFCKAIVERQADLYLFNEQVAPNIAAAIDQVHTFDSMTAQFVFSFSNSAAVPKDIVQMLEKHLVQLLDTSDRAKGYLRETFDLAELPS